MAKKEKSFEESMDRLEEIIRELQQNEKPLDETINLFEEGLELVKACDGKLKTFESRVEALSAKNDGDSNAD
jgi:exodeoxyribonuclease VII small subunit